MFGRKQDVEEDAAQQALCEIEHTVVLKLPCYFNRNLTVKLGTITRKKQKNCT